MLPHRGGAIDARGPPLDRRFVPIAIRQVTGWYISDKLLGFADQELNGVAPFLDYIP